MAKKVWRAARWGFYAHSTYNDHIRNILHQWYHAEPEVDKKKKDWVLCLTVLSVRSHWLWNKGAVAWLHWVIFYCHPDGISWLSECNTWEVSWEIWLGSVKILNTHFLSAVHPKKTHHIISLSQLKIALSLYLAKHKLTKFSSGRAGVDSDREIVPFLFIPTVMQGLYFNRLHIQEFHKNYWIN